MDVWNGARDKWMRWLSRVRAAVMNPAHIEGGRKVPNNRYLLALVLDDTVAMTSTLQFFI